RGRAGVLVPGAPGGEPGAARSAAAVPAVHRDDEGLPAPHRRRGGAMIGAGAARAPAAAGAAAADALGKTATAAAGVVAAGIIHERSGVGGGGRHACLGVFGTAANPSPEAARAPSLARTRPKTPRHGCPLVSVPAFINDGRTERRRSMGSQPPRAGVRR